LSEPIGVVLAGGASTRIGEPKATVALAGRPLISYPLAALRGALTEVVVSVAPDTPGLEDVVRWVQAAEGRHPLLGVIDALERAAPRAIVVCPVDMPFVSTATIARLVAAPVHGAVVARAGEDVQPLLARLDSSLLGRLRGLGRVRDAILALEPAWLEIDAGELLNVNTPEDLAAAERLLGYPNVNE
jgi:molybdopterin-guanine dinucleotide biosynthesis protein A